MSIDNVKKKIIQDAEKQAEACACEAEVEIRKARREDERAVSVYEQELLAHADALLSLSEKKELAAAEFEGKKMLLDRKRALIQRVIDDARDMLIGLGAMERECFLKMLLQKAQQELAVAVVYLNKKDKTALREKGLTVKEADIDGGLLAETSDGRMSVNLSVDELLEQIKEIYVRELNEVLFREK